MQVLAIGLCPSEVIYLLHVKTESLLSTQKQYRVTAKWDWFVLRGWCLFMRWWFWVFRLKYTLAMVLNSWKLPVHHGYGQYWMDSNCTWDTIPSTCQGAVVKRVCSSVEVWAITVLLLKTLLQRVFKLAGWRENTGKIKRNYRIQLIQSWERDCRRRERVSSVGCALNCKEEAENFEDSLLRNF